jgi:hypothetical protein
MDNATLFARVAVPGDRAAARLAKRGLIEAVILSLSVTTKP